MQLAIIIPTFNERDNIIALLDAIKEVCSQTQITCTVIVVDDNSPDGTASLVKSYSSFENKSPFTVELIQRHGKLGLGTAYITGFKKALEQEAEYIMEMDADFSHDPKYIPSFLNHMNDYDVIVGSRYVQGGGTKNWSVIRKFISKGGGLYARLILGIAIQDLTAGFVCYKRKVLQTLNLSSITSNGYSFQIEMKYHAAKAGFSLKELPIIFIDRVDGVSKMSSKIVYEAIWKVIKLRITGKL